MTDAINILHAQVVRVAPKRRGQAPRFHLEAWHNGQPIPRCHGIAAMVGYNWVDLAAKAVGHCALVYPMGFDLNIFVPRFAEDGAVSDVWLAYQGGFSMTQPMAYHVPRAVKARRTMPIGGGQEILRDWRYDVSELQVPGLVTLEPELKDRQALTVTRVQLAMLLRDGDLCPAPPLKEA